MREMLLAAAVCGVLALAIARTAAGDASPAEASLADTSPADASRGEAETAAILTMMGAPAIVGAAVPRR